MLLLVGVLAVEVVVVVVVMVVKVMVAGVAGGMCSCTCHFLVETTIWRECIRGVGWPDFSCELEVNITTAQDAHEGGDVCVVGVIFVKHGRQIIDVGGWDSNNTTRE